MFAACSSEELADQSAVQQTANGTRVNFSVYTPRNITRAGLDSTISTKSLTTGYHKDAGFGVFAYFTDDNTYGLSATPNFMYNQQIKHNGSAWKYEPVKYWPNEFGDKAVSDEVDRLSFFAYAPWIEVNPTNGKPVIKKELPSKEDTLTFQNKNITQISSNTATGDPIVKYVVDFDPATSVDLLWGVNGKATRYNPIDPDYTDMQNTEGLPFLNLIKPIAPAVADTTLEFNLRHALAKVKITIDLIDDDNTPAGVGGKGNVDANVTRIFLRNISINGFALDGTLNLNNTEANLPNWKAYTDGVSEITFGDNVFNDGRRDDHEGKTNGAANEKNAYINPILVQNDSACANFQFNAKQNPGITNTTVNLFGGDVTKNGGFFYVIPRGEDGGFVDIKAEYDVETIDSLLAGKISDDITPGVSTKNYIYKENIFQGQTVTDFKAGYQYEIKIHVGITSVKITASVTDWDDTVPATDVDLPDNQNGPVASGNGGAASDYEEVTNAGTLSYQDVIAGEYYMNLLSGWTLCTDQNDTDWWEGDQTTGQVKAALYTKKNNSGSQPQP